MTTLPIAKVIVAGDANVGKTSLIRRFSQGKFSASRVSTIGVDFQTQVVELPQGTLKLSIWDLAGQERFGVMRPGFYRGSRAGALVFDLSDPQSLEHLHGWRQEILDSVTQQPLVIVGNKLDLERRVTAEQARSLAHAFGAPYLETSAKTGQGVHLLFEALARLSWKQES